MRGGQNQGKYTTIEMEIFLGNHHAASGAHTDLGTNLKISP
jgi:hypothetical protein